MPASTGLVSNNEIEEIRIYSDEEIKACINGIIDSRGKAKEENVSAFLEELSVMDESRADMWRNILLYWDKVNADDFVYRGTDYSGYPDDDSLCIVVLGFQLNDDGTMKDELIGRLSVAKDVAAYYPNSYILVTGGGTARMTPGATEADSMSDWFIENGIEEDRIIVENKSMTTVENAMFSYQLLKNDYPSVDSIVIVTSDYHIPLGSLLFQSRFFMDENYSLNIKGNAAYVCDGISPFSLDSQAANLKVLAAGCY